MTLAVPPLPKGSPLLSIVIPVRDEEEEIVPALRSVVGWRDCEILVAIDERSRDGSAERALSVPGVRVVSGLGAGRGATLCAGARAARGRFLLFLHADSRLSEERARAAIAAITASSAIAAPRGRVIAAAFTIRLDSPRPVFRLLEAGINLRSRLLGLPYGDQGLLIPKEVFERAGGFRPLPRCEDLDLVLRLRRLGRIAVVDGPCSTSTRRWDREGVLAVTFRNILALARFLLTGTISKGASTDVAQTVQAGGDSAPEPSPVDRRAVRG